MSQVDVKERLVALLMQKGFGAGGATIAAEHLIANGVTVHQKGVETHTAEPYQDVTVSVNGPAAVLVVID